MLPGDYNRCYQLRLPFGGHYKWDNFKEFKGFEDLLVYVWTHCPKGSVGHVICRSGAPTIHPVGSLKQPYKYATNVTINRGRTSLSLQGDLRSYNMSSVTHLLFTLPIKSYTMIIDGEPIRVKTDYQGKGRFERKLKSLDASGWKK